jgi:hypothetical protein
MKKSIVLILLTVLVLGCKSQSVTNTKEDSRSESGIKGSWTISSVTYPGSDYIKVTSFDIADSKCFVGSTWNFIANNNKGDFALTKCNQFSSPITWFINKEGNFVMKILSENTKAKKVTEGYVFTFGNKTENGFQLIDKVNVGGKIVDVVYQFQKN